MSGLHGRDAMVVEQIGTKSFRKFRDVVGGEERRETVRNNEG